MWKRRKPCVVSHSYVQGPPQPHKEISHFFARLSNQFAFRTRTSHRSPTRNTRSDHFPMRSLANSPFLTFESLKIHVSTSRPFTERYWRPSSLLCRTGVPHESHQILYGPMGFIVTNVTPRQSPLFADASPSASLSIWPPIVAIF